MKPFFLFILLTGAGLSADPVQDRIDAERVEDARLDKQRIEDDIERRRLEDQRLDDERYRRKLEDERWYREHNR